MPKSISMKLLNTVHISVFSKEFEDFETIKNTVLKLIPFDIEKEKVGLKIIDASGFESTIKIIEVMLSKEKHTNAFLKSFLDKLSGEQRKMLILQFDTRCDCEFNFFIRLEKDLLMNGKYVITDGGNCFHIKLNLACYPKNHESARRIIQQIFG